MYVCGIIKPHALNKSEEILAALRAASAIILETKSLRFTNELVEILYDHMSAEARASIATQLVGLDGIAVLLSVPSIEWLLSVIGTESNPQACAPGTIRARFGVHAAPSLVGSELWWQNAFHRPIDEREASRDLAHIFGLYLQNS